MPAPTSPDRTGPCGPPRLSPPPPRSLSRSGGRPRYLRPCPFWASGLSPPPSSGGSAGRSPAMKQGSRPGRSFFCENSPGRPGRFSKHSSAPKTIGCLPTTFRSTLPPWWRTARRPPTWDWRCSRIYPLTISATFQPDNSLTARPAPCTQWKPWNGTGATSITGTTRNP